MEPWLAQLLAGLAVALISAGGAYLVAKATANSTQKSAEQAVTGQLESARMQAEQGAFERAKAYYESVITRQDQEHAEDRAEVQAAREEIAAARQETAAAREENAELRRRLVSQEESTRQCRAVCRRLAQRLGEPGPDFD